jgi:hypothetical protein
MIDALMKRVSVTCICYEMYAHRVEKVQLLVFWDQSRNGRHLINYRHLFTGFAESSLNQHNNALISYFLWICFLSALITDKELCKFAVNKRQNTNYSCLPVTSQVSCKRRKRGQIICWQGNNKLMVIFVLQRRKVVL